MEESLKDSLRRSFAKLEETNSEEDPLLVGEESSQTGATMCTTVAKASSNSDGTRLRSVRTADPISPTGDSAFESEDKGQLMRNIWQRVLDWFSRIWMVAFGRKQST